MLAGLRLTRSCGLMFLLLALAVAAKAADDAQAPGLDELAEPERIAKLQELIEKDRQALTQNKEEMAKLDKEVDKASMAYTALDKKQAEARQALDDLKDKGTPDELKTAQEELAGLDKRRLLARERLDVLVKQRKTLQDTVDGLEKKIEKDKAALDKLINGKLETPVAPENPDEKGKPPEQGKPPVETNGKPEPAEVSKAREEAKSKAETAEAAQAEAKSIQDRLDLLRKNIANERKLLQLAREKADVAYARQQQVQEALRKQNEAGAKPDVLDKLYKASQEADQQAREARQEVRDRTQRLDDLQREVAVLQTEQIVALQEAEHQRLQAEAAQRELARLENPFALRNMMRWAIEHGPKLLFIVFGVLVLLFLARIGERHLIMLMVRRGRGTANTVERENRARTLTGVLHNAATLILLIGGGIMILEEIGVPIVPLMGGAAVVGLAFAFGAQNLMKDYFNGFMILLENQYGINDIIRIGDTTGLVEQISLRITVIRDLEGTVHFFPHGQINSVSNLTHGWSRALFDIGVAYKESVDDVIRVLLELGRELRADPSFADLILDDPEMLGVDAFADSAVMIKFFIKTRPLKQWVVKRELLRRIKNRFDELGIEIPFPHRTVYHRQEKNGDVLDFEEVRAGR
ncbi:MAG: mechanosensitive ion channel domain-containing protein [Gemmataceae bacterium]